MITKKECLELVDYQILHTCRFLWDCFGRYAQTMITEGNGYELAVIMDIKSDVVYQVEITDCILKKAYRLTNPDFADSYFSEVKSRGVSDSNNYCEDFIDLEVTEDFLEKATAIINGKPYSTDITVPLDLSDEELLPLFKAAHAANVTFNQYMTSIIEAVIK